MRALCIAAATILLTAAAAVAEEPANSEAQQEKKICRNEKLTGSLTRVRRVCLTRSEWSRVAESTRDTVDDITRDANQSVAVFPCGAIAGCAQR